MKNKNIKILDCTLRDGGYLIDWEFGKNKIQSIINNLAQGNIDFIECGFLKEDLYDENKSFYSSISELEKLVTKSQNYTLMINFGEYDIKNFSVCKNKNIKIRLAFKKNNQKEALEYIFELKKLGWDVFANPMSTNTYSEKELFDVIKIFEFIDKFLDKKIAIGFHSHNSMQLSFSNTKALLKMNLDRILIIDSCLYGMGRGAGNLCSELIIKYINDFYNSEYKILPILKSIDEDLKPIYEKSPWGYSTPYYIAAINGCHPNYAGFLVKKSYSDEEINRILSNIPQYKKTSYDKDLIEDLAKKLFTSFSLV